MKRSRRVLFKNIYFCWSAMSVKKVTLARSPWGIYTPTERKGLILCGRRSFEPWPHAIQLGIRIDFEDSARTQITLFESTSLQTGVWQIVPGRPLMHHESLRYEVGDPNLLSNVCVILLEIVKATTEALVSTKSCPVIQVDWTRYRYGMLKCR